MLLLAFIVGVVVFVLVKQFWTLLVNDNTLFNEQLGECTFCMYFQICDHCRLIVSTNSLYITFDK